MSRRESAERDRNEVASNNRDRRTARGNEGRDEDRSVDTASRLGGTSASESGDASTSTTTDDHTDSVKTNADNSTGQLDASETDGIAASADELAAMAAAEAAARGEVPTIAANLALFGSDSGMSADATATLEAVDGDAASGLASGTTLSNPALSNTALSNTALPNTAVTELSMSQSEGTGTPFTTTANAAASATASEAAANAANSGAAPHAANAVRRARAGAAGTSNEAAGAAQNAATRAIDPLARLVQSSQDALAAGQSGGANHGAQHGANHGAIAGRLAEVEAGIARDRAQRAIAGTGASLAIDGDASTAGQIPGVTESAAEGINTAASTAIGREAAQGSLATGALPTDGSRAGASFSTSAIGAGIAQGPASDLAFVSEDSSAPAAQLAAKGAEILAKQRGGAITMRLEPPALGQLKIELRIAHGSVVADFTAATPEARVLLESSMGMLRERLESQGLGVERITVHGGRALGEATAAQGSQQGDARSQGDARGDGSGRQSDGGARQDAAGGESRGRRDGERTGQDQDHGGRGRNGSHASEQPVKRGFAGALADAGAVNIGRNGTNATRTAESVRRAG